VWREGREGVGSGEMTKMYLRPCDFDDCFWSKEEGWHLRSDPNGFGMPVLDSFVSDTLGHSFWGIHATAKSVLFTPIIDWRPGLARNLRELT
jgi:hypothetical protein